MCEDFPYYYVGQGTKQRGRKQLASGGGGGGSCIGNEADQRKAAY